MLGDCRSTINWPIDLVIHCRERFVHWRKYLSTSAQSSRHHPFFVFGEDEISGEIVFKMEMEMFQFHKRKPKQKKIKEYIKGWTIIPLLNYYTFGIFTKGIGPATNGFIILLAIWVLLVSYFHLCFFSTQVSYQLWNFYSIALTYSYIVILCLHIFFENVL